MSEIKIYVANLAAYNDGVLKGNWFTLPTPMEEIFRKVFAPYELDENGQPHGDFAIHDYEAPFEIGEYESIDYLNEVAELFDTLSDEEVKMICALKDEGVLMDLREGQEALENVIRYTQCKDMSDIAYQVIQERYGNQEEYAFFLRNFDYENYGQELDSTGTYLFLENDVAIQYLN